MRAYEILENRNPPSKPLTLRAIHKLKHDGRAREESENRRLELMPRMYPILERPGEIRVRIFIELEFHQIGHPTLWPVQPIH